MITSEQRNTIRAILRGYIPDHLLEEAIDRIEGALTPKINCDAVPIDPEDLKPRKHLRDACWYCQGFDGEMVFSIEFDCFLHLECLKKELTKTECPYDAMEANIIADELGVQHYSECPKTKQIKGKAQTNK